MNKVFQAFLLLLFFLLSCTATVMVGQPGYSPNLETASAMAVIQRPVPKAPTVVKTNAPKEVINSILVESWMGSIRPSKTSRSNVSPGFLDTAVLSEDAIPLAYVSNEKFDFEGGQIEIDTKLDGSLTLQFSEDSVGCEIQILSIYEAQFEDESVLGEGGLRSVKCLGYLDEVAGIFILDGVMDGSLKTDGNGYKTNVTFNVIGLKEGDKLKGSIALSNGLDVEFSND